MFRRPVGKEFIAAAAVGFVTVALAGGCGTSPAPPSSTRPSAAPSTSASSVAPVPTTASAAPSPTGATPTVASTTRVVSYRTAYGWAWPGPMSADTSVRHTQTVPPVPELVGISFGEHPVSVGRPYERMSFTFTHAFPSSDFGYSDTLLSVATGTVIPKPSDGRPRTGWLGVSFTVAQAHTASGASSILSQPPPLVGGQRIVSYVQAGDFEGGLNYGILVAWPISRSTPKIPVRVVEIETVSPSGQHHYTIAFDVDTTNHG